MPNIKIPEQERIQRVCDKLNRLASVASKITLKQKSDLDKLLLSIPHNDFTSILSTIKQIWPEPNIEHPRLKIYFLKRFIAKMVDDFATLKKYGHPIDKHSSTDEHFYSELIKLFESIEHVLNDEHRYYYNGADIVITPLLEKKAPEVIWEVATLIKDHVMGKEGDLVIPATDLDSITLKKGWAP
ncbi:hypothetical protein AVI51_15150 [Piscirickettsia salmonis]|uniref:Uncharacterized protein n=1 Tax=Piscirickettsia salmonis TaxID=1238 RepID=A0A9Q5VE92_PISSA|nr:hypothetical protein [Piscirickettsia salmonis]ALA24370.1 hypothetical protein KW89_902 [Piscirickettsia salmonis]APS44740.1 hypothetical protein AVI48_10435 [Piscirickettsia salmonis]APS48100.1 hypothetical protein AVI49_11040 [Piscirickettsia salmonis]APS52056.1 hypothetical protein AVI50_15305 [Piscirickettsia salmonis]APS55274.1 hypothetical protein AVI51_15150 [Piscirickettsia salmonis]